MNDSLTTLSRFVVSSDVQAFALEKGISRYLDAVVDLARQAFPSSALGVSVGQDAEDAGHRYIAVDVDVGTQAAEELLAGQRIWSTGISRVCPSHHAVYFVLGWR